MTIRPLRKLLTSHFVAAAADKQEYLKGQKVLHDFGIIERNCIFDIEQLNTFVFTLMHILKE